MESDSSSVVKKEAEPAAPLARCNLLVIRCRDIDRAVAFYTAIGLRFVQHQHGAKLPIHFASEQPGFTFELYPFVDEKDTPTCSTRLGFSVVDVDDTVAAAVAAGGTLLTPPSASPWGRRAVVVDPDGHRVELTSQML